jgi:hypothetical protein
MTYKDVCAVTNVPRPFSHILIHTVTCSRNMFELISTHLFSIIFALLDLLSGTSWVAFAFLGTEEMNELNLKMKREICIRQSVPVFRGLSRKRRAYLEIN